MARPNFLSSSKLKNELYHCVSLVKLINKLINTVEFFDVWNKEVQFDILNKKLRLPKGYCPRPTGFVIKRLGQFSQSKPKT